MGGRNRRIRSPCLATSRNTEINLEEDERVKLITMFGTTWQPRIKIGQHAQYPRTYHVLAEIPFVRLFTPVWKEIDSVAYAPPLPKCDTDTGLTEYIAAFCFNTQASQ